MFDQYPWDERKIAQTTVTPDSTGVITFDAEVDIIIAIRPATPDAANNYNIAIYPQDEVMAYIWGKEVSSHRFIPQPPDDSDNRRIKVDSSDNVATYYALTMKRFVRATIESTYDANDPSATPTDYRVLKWPIDHATEAVISYVADRYREFEGDEMTNEWKNFIAVEKAKVREQQATQRKIVPANPMFSGLGNIVRGKSTLRTV
jgi:hypothetical protein